MSALITIEPDEAQTEALRPFEESYTAFLAQPLSTDALQNLTIAVDDFTALLPAQWLKDLEDSNTTDGAAPLDEIYGDFPLLALYLVDTFHQLLHVNDISAIKRAVGKFGEDLYEIVLYSDDWDSNYLSWK